MEKTEKVKLMKTVERVMGDPIIGPPSRRSKESRELLQLVSRAGISSLAVMGSDDVLCALMAATVGVALHAMKHRDVSAWLRRIALEVDAEVKSGAGRPS